MVPFIAVLPSKWSRMGHITAHHWLGGRGCFEVVMLKLGKRRSNTTQGDAKKQGAGSVILESGAGKAGVIHNSEM